MLRIDKAILDADAVICKNISKFDDSERGLLSQNILSQLRNLVEYIAQKVYSNGQDSDPNDYRIKIDALDFIKTKGQLRFLSSFHVLLQKSVSHYTFDEGGSERLMLKYYEHLLKIKEFLRANYNIEVLRNIDDFPLNLDPQLSEYYQKISERIKVPSQYAYKDQYDDRVYIQKKKAFYIGSQIFYEVTFTIADDNVSKFDRVICFTNLDIFDNYAVKLSLHNDTINVMGKSMPIKVIDSWKVSIRQCEFNNFARILGDNEKRVNTKQKEYSSLMDHISENHQSLVDLIASSDDYYEYIKQKCTENSQTTPIFDVLDSARSIINNNHSGSNVLRYLLNNMNNRIIKKQYNVETCPYLSDLNLCWGCIPFDKMPYTTSLVNHNPKLYDLFDCIDTTGRDHEFLARIITNNTEQNGVLFTPKSDLSRFDDIQELINKYNSKLYYKHSHRNLLTYKDYVYIKGFADDTSEIIERIIELSQNGVDDYKEFVTSWLISNPEYVIDCKEKLQALESMFENSNVSLIYGSAGTGKSTLINHISHLYEDKKKLFIANTNPAVDNMRRKVTVDKNNCKFMTIKKFNSKHTVFSKYDIVVIDECSTVSNSDMKEFLSKASFSQLVLVGDVFQIESIRFGNWFSIARCFVPQTSVTELTKPFRTTEESLLTVWERVRNLDDAILEPMLKAGYTVNLDDSIFESFDKDEIVLCLNYDGLYGINNINRLLQSNNPNKEYIWRINTYKIDDPVLFNESDRFAPLIYNNMKGRIVGISPGENKITFEIELDHKINGFEANMYGIKVLKDTLNNHSVISFSVDKYRSTDEDDQSNNAIVPFQVAYAVSIHKAQGLEYSSVKIVITNEVEELITHNIFYTAITRAKQSLRIYWSPETEKKILESFSKKNYNRDASLIKTLYDLN